MEAEIKAICLVSMLAGIVGAIIPSGRMKGAFASFCAVTVVFSIILPLDGVKAESLIPSDFDTEERDEALLSDVRTAEVMLYEGMLENALEEKLSQSGIDVNIKAVCEKVGEEFSVISFVVTGCSDEESRQAAEKILIEGFEGASVEFAGDNNG